MLKKLTKKGFTLVELMIVVAIIGILAAIAIPNFLKFQAKSKQSEAKTNLKSVFTAQKSYFGSTDKYSTAPGAIGFAPEKGNRYTYALGGTAISLDTTRFSGTVTSDNAFTVGVSGTCPTCEFIANAYGNVDNDALSDNWWMISMDSGTTYTPTCGDISATAVTAGVPYNSKDDVDCE